MNRFYLAGLTWLILLGSAHAATFIPVPPVPGSDYTVAIAINDNNVITGTYVTSDGAYHGFLGTLDGNYTTFDAGTVGDTEGRGINNAGIVTGIAIVGSGGDAPIERFTDGSILPVTKDDAPLSQGIAGGINVKGVFVASGHDQSENYLSFYGKNAAYTQAIDPPGFTSPHPRGINGSKDVVGYYTGDDGADHGFLLKDGAASTLDYPSSTGTYLYGINDGGTIAGSWSDGKGNLRAFTYDSSTKQFTPIELKNVKGGKYGQILGDINNKGLVAVNFYAAGGSFIYCPRKPSKCPAGGIDIGPSLRLPAKPTSQFTHPAAVNPDQPILFRNGVVR